MPHLIRILATLLLSFGTFALADVTLDVHYGTSIKPLTTLEIVQEGHEPTMITGVNYETRPWLPNTNLGNLTQNYYGVRVGYYPFEARPGRADIGVELELLHDKAYYVDGNDSDNVVQHFELSDGVNYLMTNAVLRYPIGVDDRFTQGRTQLLARSGFGVVYTKPASTIRGQGLGHDLHGTLHGYEIAGIGFQFAAQARQFLLPWLALSAEGKFTYSNPEQSIAGGTARTSLPSFHVNAGLTFATNW